MTDSIVADVVSSVANKEGVEPTELGFVLRDLIDPEALEAVVATQSERCELTFEVPGYRVTVLGTGDVTVDSLEESGRSMQGTQNGVTRNGSFAPIESRADQAELPPISRDSDQLPDLCFVFDGDGIYRDSMTKAGGADLLVGTPDGIIGRSVHDVLPDAPADTILSKIRAALNDNQTQIFTVQFEVPIGRRTFLSHIRPLPGYQDEQLVLMTERDVTEHSAEWTTN